ncbi:MAG: hypothetical protein K6G89_07810 [Clostridia bacterium]|nr:hypothetical protein [Clostridia bacterium]
MTGIGNLFEIGQSAGSEALSAFWIAYIVTLIICLIAAFFLAIIPSKIASRKGYSKVGFYWFGVGALIPAIIVACVLKNKNTGDTVIENNYQQ